MAGPSVSFREIFIVFGKVGALSFGGGLAGWVYREVVLKRAWLSEKEFLSGMALSQVLPGANVTNLSVYIGQRLRGTLGAMTALTGLLIAPFFLVLGFFLLYDVISTQAWVARAISGVAAAAIGLLAFATWRTGKHSVRSVHGVAAALATFIAVGVLHWPLLPVVLFVTPLSVAAAWRWGRPDAP